MKYPGLLVLVLLFIFFYFFFPLFFFFFSVSLPSPSLFSQSVLQGRRLTSGRCGGGRGNSGEGGGAARGDGEGVGRREGSRLGPVRRQTAHAAHLTLEHKHVPVSSWRGKRRGGIHSPSALTGWSIRALKEKDTLQKVPGDH